MNCCSSVGKKTGLPIFTKKSQKGWIVIIKRTTKRTNGMLFFFLSLQLNFLFPPSPPTFLCGFAVCLPVMDVVVFLWVNGVLFLFETISVLRQKKPGKEVANGAF